MVPDRDADLGQRQGAEIFRRPRDEAPLAFSGERLTSDKSGQVEIEHLHRYFLARELCRGRHVLDVACGEGYGAALLAQVALSVSGVDYDQATIVHAQAAFPAANLRFIQSDATALPFADASFDAVVSFETIEHFAAQETFLMEIRRVLRPGGLLVASSPDRDHYSGPSSQPNPFHVRELDRAEFVGLLGRHFAHVATTVQRSLVGSVLVPEADDSTSLPIVFERRGADLVRGCRGLPHAVYVVCAASDAPVALPPSLYIDNSDLDGPAARLAEAKAALDQATAEAAGLRDRLASAEQAGLDMEGILLDARTEADRWRRAHETGSATLLAELARAKIAQAAAEQVAAARQEAEAGAAAARDAAEAEAARLHLTVRAAALETAWAETRLAAVENSTFWKISWPLRRLMSRSPRLALTLRRTAQLLWWTLTGQLPRRLRWWRAKRAARRAVSSEPVPTFPAEPEAGKTETWAPPHIDMPRHAQPVVRIIVASYGQVPVTLDCLASIAAAPTNTPFEVVVADDASGDPALVHLRGLGNVTLIENPRNLGYLLNCNAAARGATAEFLLFLNNDTKVRPGWLDALVDVMRRYPKAGAAGAKLIYPDGRLQEAGGIVWADGSGWNYGRLDDPDKPIYNYVREVDYISGAALLVRRELFEKLDGFDPAYAPAYCEDSDLAFRLRAAGHVVVYQPRSEVVHMEGVSHGTDLSAGAKRHQVTNTAKLAERWRNVLAAEHFPKATRFIRARDRAYDRAIVLVIDHYVPQPDRDAGSRTMLAMMRVLLQAGRVVKFWPDNAAYSPGYTEALQDLGIEVLYGPATQGFETWIAENGAELDGVMLSRPDVATRYIAKLRRHSRARLVYYGHDLHGARKRRQANLTDDAAMNAAADGIEAVERAVWRQVDVALYPSAEEAAEARALEPGIDVREVVPYAFTTFGEVRQPPTAPELLFVGGFAHPPNEDAAEWLVASILPAIRACMEGVHLSIVGSNPTPRVRGLAGAGVEVRANVSDDELVECYRRARVAVVPLRYGAGVKLKVVEALVRGIPLVTTPVGAQGCEDIEEIVAVTANPAVFADAVCTLLADDAAWMQACARQLAYARDRFTEDRLRRSLIDASGL